ncbi:hypothetical protein BZA77DRAFT_246506 [Pyronema omphalodes]|nr:hypothetical protein BZA77DRAFT_246506 [Pyronema omphalodes]
MEKRLVHSHIECPFPWDSPEIVPVTPQYLNKGWANSYDRPCTAGLWCQYACKPGTLMHQWNPEAVAYAHPWKEQGGLYCGEDGVARKPFPNRNLCYEATRKLPAVNTLGGDVYMCQTVLPGDEAMRIPNLINRGTTALLAVPGPEFWPETKPGGAHYYINSPGVSVDDACVWGNNTFGAGNWAPYSFGTNHDNGEMFVSLNWNPVWFETASHMRKDRPEFGVRIECEGPNCHNAPCFIDPRIHSVNQVSYGQGFVGAGDANACVVTAGRDSQIRIVLF